MREATEVMERIAAAVIPKDFIDVFEKLMQARDVSRAEVLLRKWMNTKVKAGELTRAQKLEYEDELTHVLAGAY